MTAVEPELRPSPPASADPVIDRSITMICPYLASADGAWRSVTVAREHRCGAVVPPSLLTPEKQRRLCLTTDHATCPTYEAARAARPLAQDRSAALPRPLARATPVVLDHGRIAISVPALRAERSVGQVVLLVLLILAFALVVLAKLAGGNTPVGTVNGSPGVPAAAVASTAAVARPSATAPATTAAPGSATASVGPGAVAGATATPPASTKTYKVKAGDTLVGIAAKYGTTAKALAKLNSLKDSANLKVGQVLKVP